MAVVSIVLRALYSPICHPASHDTISSITQKMAIGEGLDVVACSAGDEGEHRGRSMPSRLAAGEQPVATPDRDPTQAPLTRVVIDFQASVVEVLLKRLAKIQRVLDRGAQA